MKFSKRKLDQTSELVILLLNKEIAYNVYIICVDLIQNETEVKSVCINFNL